MKTNYENEKKSHWIEMSIQRLIIPVNKSERNQKDKRKIKQY